jgi:hypothetical protein
LERLRREKLYAKLEKCEFWLDNVSFFGHIISGKGVAIDPEKVKAVVEWTRPTSVFAIRSFFKTLVIIDASLKIFRSCWNHSLL